MINFYLVKALLFSALLFGFLTGFSKGKITAGPMQGATENDAMKVWLMAKDADSVTLNLVDSATSLQASTQTLATKVIDNFKGNVPLTFSYEHLLQTSFA